MKYFNYSKKRMREDYTVIRSLSDLHLDNSSYKPVITILRGRKFKEVENTHQLCDKKKLLQLTRILSNEGLGVITHVPSALENIALLEAIDLTNNAITKVPDWLGDLTFLRNISFHNNNLSCWPLAFDNLNFLETIYLSHNPIGRIPHSAIEHMPNLEKLSVPYCDLTEFKVQFPSFCQLRYLDLSWNDIEFIDADLSQCNKLEHLNLSNMKLTSLPKDIFELLNLTFLSISGTQVLRVPEEIVQLTKLQFLDLSECELISIPLEILMLPNLKELHLGGNYFTEEYKKQIIKSAPESLQLDFQGMFDGFDDSLWD